MILYLDHRKVQQNIRNESSFIFQLIYCLAMNDIFVFMLFIKFSCNR